MEDYSMKIGLLIAAASAALLSSVVSSAAYENAPGVSANGRRINIALDEAYSPAKAVEQTRRLVESDEVAFIFG
jgi:opacity protein-like surface antigen